MRPKTERAKFWKPEKFNEKSKSLGQLKDFNEEPDEESKVIKELKKRDD